MASFQPSDSSPREAGPMKPEVIVNVYDLIPPGRLSSMLWMLGSSILHSGVVVDDREYAFGGHNEPGRTGIYWTRPGLLPPGGTFRCEISMGLAQPSSDEIQQIIRQTSAAFLGPSWNLLTNNCNHFTSMLCHQLTGNSTPYWLNRASTIGIALPCLIPTTWLSPPTAETADGGLLEDSVQDDDDNDDDETAAMLQRGARHATPGHDSEPEYEYASLSESSASDEEIFDTRKRRRRRIYRNAAKVESVAQHTDSSGRPIPVSERAPVTNG